MEKFILRTIHKEEETRWKELCNKHHYLGFSRIPGEGLRYIAERDGTWLALIGWGSAAFKCKVRDNYIGWTEEQKIKRLPMIVNNVRFCILPEAKREKNLASAILARNLQRLSDDYLAVFGHPVYLAETFVDSTKYRGTCYRAANWVYKGQTRGYSKSGKKYYPNNIPKSVFLYPLQHDVPKLLTQPFLPYDYHKVNQKHTAELNKLPVKDLIEVIKEIIDPRKPRGIRYQLHTVLGIAICAVICGARTYQAIADWAKGLTIPLLRLLGSRRREPPSEPTIRRILQKIHVESFDREIGKWLMEQYKFPIEAIAIDGKTLCGSGDKQKPPIHLLSAIVHKEGVVIAQKSVDSKTNEITVSDELLKDIPLFGKVVTADALHTQRKFAEHLTQERKADYIFTVKGNQQTLLDDIKTYDFKKNRMQ